MTFQERCQQTFPEEGLLYSTEEWCRGLAVFYFGEALWALTGGAPWAIVQRRLMQVQQLWRQAS